MESVTESTASLYLIPSLLGDTADPFAVLPTTVIERVRTLRFFVVENAKSTRRFLKLLDHPTPLQQLSINELPRSEQRAALEEGLLDPIQHGNSIGLISEAGLPCIADPGYGLVAAAHAAHIPIEPLVGPSSLLLALMASGLCGQRFTFHGYLPHEREARHAALKEWEAARNYTHIFIETPYRTKKLSAELLDVLNPSTILSVALDLTLPSQQIHRAPVREWRVDSFLIRDVPAVFVLGSENL